MCWICLRTIGKKLAPRNFPQQQSLRGLTRQEEENEPVHNQNRPENRDVEDLEPTADKSQRNDSRCRVPELELGQTANKGPKFLVRLCGQRANGAVLHLGVHGLVGRVELGLKEGEEEVE